MKVRREVTISVRLNTLVTVVVENDPGDTSDWDVVEVRDASVSPGRTEVREALDADDAFDELDRRANEAKDLS